MYLKSIVLKGFKSFPDRTRLEFGPGVSVIVGPNGSGKSNVTDAVLWALGEQSPLAVRGQSMQDVIFAGAPGRQASRSAEVELILDDSEGSLGLGVPEVSILRRLDRTGEGEYRLAGARCRLVDVIEILSDTGLGKEMHSVISQGRVESIVTSKPRDRRLLIEEAAGLGKHRKRRRRAQLKLARTQDNLDRALDVEREARSRLRPLKRQAEAAELHERLERQSLEARWELARDDLRTQRRILAEAERRAGEARSVREQLERDLEAIARRREAAEEALAGRSAQREELSRRCFAAQAAAERVSYRVDALRGAAVNVEERIRRNRAALEALAQAAEGDPDDPGAESRITALEAELEGLGRDRQERLAEQLVTLEAELRTARQVVEERTQALDAVLLQRNQAEERSKAAAAEVRRAERGVEAARRQAAGVGAELAAVNQFLRTQAGRPGEGVVLADQLEVDPGYEHAVAAALDGRLRAAVVPDRASAEDLLDRLGSEGARTLISGGASTAPAAAETAPGTQAERLIGHVSGPSEVTALVAELLANTWVVGSLEEVPAGFTGSAVTRGGRVWSARSREIRQAPAVGEERVLAERNRRDRLIAESEAAAQGEVAAAAALEGATAEFQRAETARDEAIIEHRRAVGERDEAAEHERRIAARLEHRRTAPEEGPAEDRRRGVLAELAGEREKLERLAAQRAERTARTERLGQALAHDEQLLPSIEATTQTLVAVTEAIAVQRRAFDAALEADRQAGEHVAAELRTCAREEAALQARLHGAAEVVTEAEVALHRARDRASEVEGELGRLAARLEFAAEAAEEALPPEQRATLEGRLERLARRREQLGPVNPLAQQEYAEAVEHVEDLERQRADLETALRELEKLISDTDRQIRETFEQTFTAAARNFEQVAAQLFPGGRGQLRLVSDTEGQPRVLGGGGADGADAGGAEPAPGAEADEPTGPGATPEEDLLGVEIEINPAGKEMKRLTLLSGGEKSMTALAFLFAVFLARPCPFYILDEVEAALDDLNIDRFLSLLRSYSGHAQFIVVTHQRRTMEAADFLYGVSMGADGISKVISQRLSREAEAAA